MDEDDDISVVSIYNGFYGDNIDGSKEVEEVSLPSNSSSTEQLTTYLIEENTG